MHPFLSFCLYVSARVFIQYLKSRPDDQQVLASLQFLLSTMQILKMKNPLTESFLIQLDVDLEGTGLDDPAKSSGFAYSMKKGVVCLFASHLFIHLSPSSFTSSCFIDSCPLMEFVRLRCLPRPPTSASVPHSGKVIPMPSQRHLGRELFRRRSIR